MRRRGATRMRDDEARSILEQAAAGRLDEQDPSIRKVIDAANRRSVRTELWGSTPTARARTRGLLLVMVAGVALFVGGLVLEFVLHP